MLLIRAVTNLTTLILAVVLAAISFKSMSVASLHIHNQSYINAIIPLIVSVSSISVAISFTSPIRRQNLLAHSYPPTGRFFFILLCLASYGVILLAGILILHSGTPRIYGFIPTKYITPFGIGFGALFCIIYIFPGLAFLELRKADLESRLAASNNHRKQNIIYIYFGGASPQQNTVSRIARIIYSLVFIIYFFISLYGVHNAQFLPDKQHLEFASKYHLVMALILIAILSYLILLWQQTPGKGPFRFIAVQKFGVALLTSIIITIYSYPFLAQGLPDLYSFTISGKIYRKDVVVLENGDKTTRGCDRTAIIAPLDNIKSAIKICSIPVKIWETLSIGDVLTLSGKHTPFGMHYTAVSIAYER